MILRANQHANLSALTPSQAYSMGDVTGDKANNHADFALFKEIYDEANGVGAFDVMAGSVPEPAAGLLLLTAALTAFPLARRSRASR
jgi:hypothetical protein